MFKEKGGGVPSRLKGGSLRRRYDRAFFSIGCNPTDTHQLDSYRSPSPSSDGDNCAAIRYATEAFTVTITFSEGVDNFVQGDITLNPSSLASVTSFTGNDGDTEYTATITPTSGEQGTLTIEVAANVANSTADATQQNAAGSAMVEVDAKAPTPTITPPSGTQTGAFDVTFTLPRLRVWQI